MIVINNNYNRIFLRKRKEKTKNEKKNQLAFMKREYRCCMSLSCVKDLLHIHVQMK